MSLSVSVGNVWSDIDHRFVKDSLGTLKTVTNVQSVMTSIDNILRTSPGERCMLPEFGCGLKSMVFENMNSAIMTFVSRQIKEAIERWDDRLIVTEVNFYANPDDNSVSMAVRFCIIGHNQIFEYVTSIGGEIQDV